MSKRLLITGFDPFGGSTANPSWMAVERLPETVGDFVLCKLAIPTVFGKAAAMILEKAEEQAFRWDPPRQDLNEGGEDLRAESDQAH